MDTSTESPTVSRRAPCEARATHRTRGRRRCLSRTAPDAGASAGLGSSQPGPAGSRSAGVRRRAGMPDLQAGITLGAGLRIPGLPARDRAVGRACRSSASSPLPMRAGMPRFPVIRLALRATGSCWASPGNRSRRCGSRQTSSTGISKRTGSVAAERPRRASRTVVVTVVGRQSQSSAGRSRQFQSTPSRQSALTRRLSTVFGRELDATVTRLAGS